MQAGGHQEGGDLRLQGLGMGAGHAGAGGRRMRPQLAVLIEFLALDHAPRLFDGGDGQKGVLSLAAGDDHGLARHGQAQHQKAGQGVRAGLPAQAAMAGRKGPFGAELQRDRGEGVEQAVLHHPPIAVLA